jgi:uncharacterized membrane protein
MNLIIRLRLIFAVAWLLTGLGVCAYQIVHPESSWGWLRLGGTPVSLGWAALLLGLYNLARWWASRAGVLARKQQEAELAARSRPRRREGPPAEYDPNFDFSDNPPESGQSPNGSS